MNKLVIASLIVIGAGCAAEKPPVKTVHIGLAVEGNGTVVSAPDAIVCGTRCTADLPMGTHLTLQARADPGNKLAGWDGSCAATTGEIVDVTLTAELVCVARFEKVEAPVTPPVMHTLTVVALGPGSVQASAPQNVSVDCRDETCTGSLPEASVITVAANADPGAEVVGFSDDCSALSATAAEVTLDTDRICTVSFFSPDDVTYPLRVLVVGDGNVTASPGNINCNASSSTSSCESRYPSATTVTLTATPSAGSQFHGWGQACAGFTDAAMDIEIDYGTACSAIFDRTFSVTVVGKGTVTGPGMSCTNFCNQTLSSASEDLTEAPDVGWAFAGWSGDCTGDATATTTTVPADAHGCTATFTKIPPQITVAIEGDGAVTSTDNTINCPSTACTADVINHPALVDANPTSWTCNQFFFGTHTGCNCGCGLPDPDCPSTSVSSCVFFTGCGADFVVEDQNNLCYVEPHGGVPTVTLTATASAGSSFSSWSGACSGTDPTVVVSVPDSVTCTAAFTTP